MIRPAIKQVPRYRIRATPLARLTIWAAGFYAVIQGAGILGANPIRFSGPSYTVLQDVPGAPASWGLSAIVIGCLILIGSVTRRWWVKAAGLLLLSTWALLFSLGALGAVYVLPTAGTTGPPTYALITVWTAILIWVDEGAADVPDADHLPG